MKKTPKDRDYVIYAKSEEALEPEIPSWCPVCSCIMKNADDVHMFKKHQCCSICFKFWVLDNPSRWDEGWRPTKKDIQEKFGYILFYEVS